MRGEMADEWERKKSLENRSAGIPTNVGVVTGIAFGAASLVLQTNSDKAWSLQAALAMELLGILGLAVAAAVVLITRP